MNNILKFSKIVKIFFLIIAIILFIFSVNDYVGNKYIYFIFSLVFSLFFLSSFNKNEVKFFNFFLSIYLWLGFVFKFFVCIKIIDIFPEGTGKFDFSPKSFDEVMIVSSIGVLGFYLGQYIFPINNFKINFNLKFLESFYLNYSKTIIYLVIALIIFFTSLNFIFGIFQKGFTSNLFFGELFRNFIAFLLMVGFGTLISFIINYELNRGKYNIIYLSVLETFFSSMSMLSRGMIFNIFPFIIGYICKINKHKFKRINLQKILIFLLVILCLIIFSIISTSNIRNTKNISSTNLIKDIELSKIVNLNSSNNNFPVKKISLSNSYNENFKIIKLEEKSNNKITFKNYIKTLFDVIYYRFIGIEGVMSVQSKEDKSLSLYFDSFKENYEENNISYYDKNFLLETSTYTLSLGKFKNQHAITLPGFIAHSYYSGSWFFVFFLALFVSFFCNIVLSLTQKIFYNVIFTAFISNLLAYRLIHWGFAPVNSYKLILAIILSMVTLVILNYAIKKFYFKK